MNLRNVCFCKNASNDQIDWPTKFGEANSMEFLKLPIYNELRLLQTKQA